MLQRPLPPQVAEAIRRKIRQAPRANASSVPRSSNEMLDALLQFSDVDQLRKLFVAASPVNAMDATYTLDSTSIVVSNARPREYLFIANMGANDIRLSFGKPATISSGLVLAGDGFIEPLRPFSSSINALAVAGSVLLVIEG